MKSTKDYINMLKLIPNGIVVCQEDLEEIFSQEEKENDEI